MGLSKYKFRELLQESFRKNQDLEFDISYVRGISNNKQITSTKANVDEAVIRKFYIVNPGEFVYNPRTTRMGDKVGLGFNNTETPLLFSFNNIAFFIKETAKATILPEYLYMYFNRPEFDRYAMINGWGSATELFSFEEMCDIEINLPPIDIQQKYVAIYNAMLANQQSYGRGLEDLELTCETLIDDYKHKAPKISVGDILHEVDNRNTDNSIADVQGINITKQFMPSVANTTGVDLSKYKAVQKGQFAFSGMQTGRDECIRIALFHEDTPIIISPAYSVFEMKRADILAEYVMMWFSRKEVDRLGWFMSDASIRTNLDMERFYEIKIPVPALEVQKSIVEIYQIYNSRKEINEKLKTQIKDLCPILIKGSIEEARR